MEGSFICIVNLWDTSPTTKSSTVFLPFSSREVFISHFSSVKILSAFPISFHLSAAFTWTWPHAGGRHTFPLLTYSDTRSEELTRQQCKAKSRNVLFSCSGVNTTASFHGFMNKCCKIAIFSIKRRQVSFRLSSINKRWTKRCEGSANLLVYLATAQQSCTAVGSLRFQP